jgi:ribosome maturation factor RimP
VLQPTGDFYTPVFFACTDWHRLKAIDFDGLKHLKKGKTELSAQQVIEQIVTGFGYDLVEIERSAGGLLRVTIDFPWMAGTPKADEKLINVEDCEKVTRQLQFALEVDGADYKRLEVSSPGIDRPLRHAKDFERFLGEEIDITLKAPIGLAAAGQVNATRKKFRGTLEKAEHNEASAKVANAAVWQIVWSEAPVAKPGARISKKRPPAPVQALGFRLEELRDARLAPIVNFKGRTNTLDSAANVSENIGE